MMMKQRNKQTDRRSGVGLLFLVGGWTMCSIKERRGLLLCCAGKDAICVFAGVGASKQADKREIGGGPPGDS